MGKNHNKTPKGGSLKRLKRKSNVSLDSEEADYHPPRRKGQTNSKKPKYKESSEESEQEMSELEDDYSSAKKGDLEDSFESDFDYSQDEGDFEDEDEDSLMSQSDLNDDFCFNCKDEGKLICCDNCFKAFHLSCLNLRKTPNGKWECPYCDETKKEVCSKCNKNKKEEDLKLTCSLCYKL